MQPVTHKTQRLASVLLTAIVAISLLGFSQPGSASASNGNCNFNFGDVPANHWAYSSIQYLYCTGVVNGTDTGHFSPNAPSTREQFAKLVVLLNGWALQNPPTPTFNDVSQSNIFYQFIETAYAHGAISGYGNGTFHPNDPITRAQISVIMVRANGWSGQTPTTPSYTDVPSSYWAYQFIEAAAGSDVVSGYPDGTFQPNALVTRAQLSRILYSSVASNPENNGDVSAADMSQDEAQGPPEGADAALDDSGFSGLAGSIAQPINAPAVASKPNQITAANVTGVTTDSVSGNPISGTLIIVHQVTTECLTSTVHFTTTTATDGSYNLSIAAGTYFLSAYNPGQLYPLTHYGVITVTDGMTITANFSLSEGASIGGTISDGATSQPISGASAWARTNPISRGFGSFRSDSNGSYRIIVPAGTYFAFAHKFSDTYPRGAASGNPFAVTVGQVITNANIMLNKGGTIQGSVTDATTNQPLACSRVWATYPGSDQDPVWARNYGWPRTDSNGNYSIVVPTGTLLLRARNIFLDYPTTPYTGNPITLTVGQVITGANFSLTQGGVIQGQITDATSGQPIPLSRVWAASLDEGHSYQAWPMSDAQGYYRILVPAGAWKVYAQNFNAFYPRTAYPGNPVTVTVGSAVSANISMTEGGLITGHIVDSATHQPVQGVDAWARPLGGGLSYGWLDSNENGVYRIAVPIGRYRTYARSVALMYPRTPADGIQVITSTGQTINEDIVVTKGGLITGTITDQNSGQPLPNSTVFARLMAGGKIYGDLRTNQNGVYVIVAPAGTLRLGAFNIPLHYPFRAYPDNPVTLSQGQVVNASWTLVQW